MTVPEIAAYLRVKPCTVYKLVRTRRIPFLKQGGILRFRQRDLETWEKSILCKPLDK